MLLCVWCHCPMCAFMQTAGHPLPSFLPVPSCLQRLMMDNPEAAANLAKMVAKQVGL